MDASGDKSEHGGRNADDGKVLVSRGVLRFAKLQFAVFVFVVMYLLVVEVGLRFVQIPGFTRQELAPPAATDQSKFRMKGHPYLSYSLRPLWKSEPGAKYQVSHNSMGFRGPETTWEKPDDVYRIVCLGGSSTYGHTPSNDANTWPMRLQFHLNEAMKQNPAWVKAGRRVEVINGGCSGYSTFESLVNLEFRMVDFKPDLVLVYHSINDMRCALWKLPPQRDNTHWRDVWGRDVSSPIEPYLEGSMTYLIWRHRFTDFLSRRQSLDNLMIVGYDANETDPYPKTSLAEVSPIGFLNFRRNLMSIVAVARVHGARIMFGTQGNDKRDFAGRKSAVVQLEAMEQMTRILRSVANDQHVPVVETAKALEEARNAEAKADPDAESKIFSNEVHLFDAGTDLLARTWAKEILAQELVH